MNSLPRLETERLILRPFHMDDAPLVHAYLSDERITVNMRRIPHPCSLEWVENYLRQATTEDIGQGRYQFAVDRKSDQQLVGRINIRVTKEHHHAEIGYWIGVPHWGQGYATEAGRRILRFGFKDLGLHRIIGTCYSWNAASARVLQHLGMRYEMTMRQDTFKNGKFADSQVYGILRDEFIPTP